MLPADAPYFFCGLPFRPHQVGRKLNWLLGLGEIRQLIAGVYVDVRVPDTISLRADALRLLVPPKATVCGRAAAWLHGIETTALAPDLFRPEWTYTERPAMEVDGVKVTTPAATAIELATRLPRPFALSAVDALLHAGMTMDELTAASVSYFPSDSSSQPAQLLRIADGRAESPGESWLRLRLFDARFPRPDLQVRVEGTGGRTAWISATPIGLLMGGGWGWSTTVINGTRR